MVLVAFAVNAKLNFDGGIPFIILERARKFIANRLVLCKCFFIFEKCHRYSLHAYKYILSDQLFGPFEISKVEALVWRFENLQS